MGCFINRQNDLIIIVLMHPTVSHAAHMVTGSMWRGAAFSVQTGFVVFMRNKLKLFLLSETNTTLASGVLCALSINLSICIACNESSIIRLCMSTELVADTDNKLEKKCIYSLSL